MSPPGWNGGGGGYRYASDYPDIFNCPILTLSALVGPISYLKNESILNSKNIISLSGVVYKQIMNVLNSCILIVRIFHSLKD